MKLKTNITLALLLFFICFISGCTSIKENLTGVSKKKTGEFLVKKKDPLVMPPNFNDLPKPQTQNTEEDDEKKNIDFSKVINNTNLKKEKDKTVEGSLERSISNILNNK